MNGMTSDKESMRVFVTGATGFVGRYVVRELLALGHHPVCLVRSPGKLESQHREIDPSRYTPITGGLTDRAVLAAGIADCHAVVHLVGIIIARRLQGQTFQGVHVRGTRNVVDAARSAGVKRYGHMSALGTRPGAASEYHRTKWDAEEYVRASGLDWTIFRPSLIHGPDGEFMQLVKKFVCGMVPPVIPYFGDGQAKLQPVSVKDVAHCFVDALRRPESVGQVYELGGPRAYTWLALYDACKRLIPGSKKWKPWGRLPVPIAKAAALLSAPPMAVAELVAPSLGLMRFDVGQVLMSQEDSVCDPAAAEKAFGIRMRSFEDELALYADQIP